MIAQIALYLQTSPQRQLALETYTLENSSLDQTLIIRHDDNNTLQLELQKSINKKNYTLLSHVYGYLGNLRLQTYQFALFISTFTGGERINIFGKKNIFKIENVLFVCLNDDRWDHDVMKEEDEAEYVLEKDEREGVIYKEFQDYFKQQFFYFSHQMDLTVSLQKKNQNTKSGEKKYYVGDSDFLWNQNLLMEQLNLLNTINNNIKLQQFLFTSGLITPIIQGLVDTYLVPDINDINPVNCTLISRLCWKRAGTRFNTRGIDDDGYVANFVETELIISSNEETFSFIIVRGSVPTFWKQEGNQVLGHKFQLSRGSDASQYCFNLHINWLQERYTNVFLLNLLSQNENNIELSLSQIYEELIANLDTDNIIHYTAFDYHFACKGGNVQNAHQFIEQIQSKIEQFEYFLMNNQTKKIINLQNGVIRINCLDCLDRTNLIQGMILNFIQLNYFQKKYQQKESINFIQSKLNQSIIKNGDQISKIYAGTGALQSNVHQFGKSNLLDKLNDASKSVTRLYQNMFLDDKKYLVIHQLLFNNNNNNNNKLIKSNNNNNSINNNNNNNIKNNNSNNIHNNNIVTTNNNFNRELIIHCGTYNVNGRYPSKESLLLWLESKYHAENQVLPDIYAIVFEEIVELTPSQILNADLNRSLIWKQILLRDLNLLSEKYEVDNGRKNHYHLLSSEQLVGICLFIFVKKEIIGDIKLVSNTKKKTGLGGMAGNKGATAIRFQLFNSTFCFVGAHFASGQSKLEDRNRDFNTVHYGLNFFNFGSLENHDYLFYIGDFNYRINLSYERVLHSIKNNDLGSLLAKDQLLNAMKLNLAFPHFNEMPITFFPTYKFDVHTDDYDTSEKKRIPAWTDRILFRGDKIIPLYYSDAKLYESDHKPVLAGFKIPFFNNEKSGIINHSHKHKKNNSVSNNNNNNNNKLKVDTLIDIRNEDLLSTIGLPQPSNDYYQWWESIHKLDNKLYQTNSIENSLKDSSIKNPFRIPQLKSYLKSIHYPMDSKSMELIPPKLPQRSNTVSLLD